MENALQHNEATATAFQDTIQDTHSPISCMTSSTTAAKPRRRALLTDTAIKNAKPDPQRNVRLSDVGGLFLLLKPNGARLWRVQLYLRGKQIMVALGQYPAVSLAQARERLAAARKQVADGINPVRAKQQADLEARQKELRENLGTFAAVCAAWRAKTDPDLRPVSVKQRHREIKNDLLPVLQHRSVDSITRVELKALLDRVKERAPETARNLRTHLEAIFEHAIDSGLRDDNPTPPRRIFGNRKQKNHAALPADRMGSFLHDLDKAAGMNRMTQIAMLLVVLNAGRKDEIISGRWAEIDLDAAIWSIPGSRMKAGHDHVVPLSSQALALLGELRAMVPVELEHLFPNRRDHRRPMANRSLNAVLDRMGLGGEATVHGFRSAFSTKFNSEGENADVIEACLAHVHGNAVRRTYNKADYMPQRRELLQRWADYLDTERAKEEPATEDAELAEAA